MQDEIYTLLQERREQVVLEDYMKPEHIKHLQLFEYQVKHLTTFKEIPENVEITMRKEAAGDEADEEEITEYDVLMRVKITPLTDEPMMEMKRIEKMDIEQAKREMEVPQTDYVARMIGQAHKSSSYMEDGMLELRANWAEIKFVFGKYTKAASMSGWFSGASLTEAQLVTIMKEGQMAKPQYNAEKVMAIWQDLIKRRGKVGLPEFMEGLMLVAFARSNPQYELGTKPPGSLAINSLSGTLSTLLSRSICLLAVEETEALSKHFESDLYAWPFTRRERSKINTDLKKVRARSGSNSIAALSPSRVVAMRAYAYLRLRYLRLMLPHLSRTLIRLGGTKPCTLGVLRFSSPCQHSARSCRLRVRVRVRARARARVRVRVRVCARVLDRR